jgi:23S rRNA maturation-related 3'-5' exoribonuclease YhaM
MNLINNEVLTETQISTNKDTIVSLLRSVKRKGIEAVIRYLEDSGFFTAPSSINRHHNWKGGLAEHCLGVYQIACTEAGELPKDSIIIAGLLHDICKASKLYYNANGNIQIHHTHIKGHGYRSVKLLEICGLSLSEDERLAIRWHMGGHHASESEHEEVIAARMNPLWKLIHRADHEDASRKK